MQIRYFYLLLFLTTILLVDQTIAASTVPKNEIGIILINDTFFGTDRYYTGSIGAYYNLNSIPLLLKYQIDTYTPNSKYREAEIPPQVEHPYAGFGYISAEYKRLTNNILLSVKAQIGATGKYSFANEMQDALHRGLNQSTFAGWDTQIQTRFGYILNPRFQYLLHFKNFSFLPYLDIELGNIISQHKVGIKLLSGINYNRDFLFSHYHKKYRLDLNLSYDISNISKNVFLTGFNDYEYAVDIVTPVQELIVGFDWQYKQFGITFQNHFRSTEFKSQIKAHKYTSLILYFLY